MKDSKKVEKLRNLLNIVYHAEGVIDGEWDELEFPEFDDDINEYYDHTINTLRNFMSIIRTRIKQEKGE